MKSQLYCSRECYKKAWPINNREKAAKRSRDRRATKPEWYRKNESRYYYNYRSKQLLTRPWRYTFQSRRSDARNKKLDFTIDDDWCAARWTGHCELTGIKFVKNPGKRGPHIFSCSLDRIKPEIGYTPENTRFVLWGCNGLKGSATDEDMYVVAEALTKTRSQSVAGILALPG